MLNISGTVNKVIYHNEENGYSVIEVTIDNRSTLRVTGYISNIRQEQYIEASGNFETNKYGRQFKANILRELLPVTENQIRRYLSSGIIEGIGKGYANRLVDMFGTSVFDVLDKNPEEFLKVGISAKKLDDIIASWKSTTGDRELNLFLYTHKIAAYKERLKIAYKGDIIDKIKTNPYQLIEDIKGIGFKIADAIALSLSLPKTSPFRIAAGIDYIFSSSYKEGDCGILIKDLIEKTQGILAVESSEIIKIAKEQIQEGLLIKDPPHIYQKSMYEAETYIAKYLLKLKEAEPNWGALTIETDFLSKQQELAVETLLSQNFSILTGGPGVGKTTVLKEVVRVLREQQIKVELCAPTGKAARRLSIVTGVRARTIHSRFGIYEDNFPGFEADLVIVDEASMIDTHLMEKMLKRFPGYCSLLLVGDYNQLPSIGPGQVLCDIIKSNIITVPSLSHVFRQKGGSNIIPNAHLINSGFLPKVYKDFNIIDCSANIKDTIIELFTKLIAEGIPDNLIQVLTPIKTGEGGSVNLNIFLQELLNPNGFDKPAINHFDRCIYRLDDRVMQTKNNYDKKVFNGMIGVIVEVFKDSLTIEFEDKEELVSYNKEEFKDLIHAYAITIHKSQGSEFDHVIIPLTRQAHLLLKRNLIYTAVTRAKKTVHLITDNYSLQKAVSTVIKDTRITTLYKKLNSFSAVNA